MKRPAFQFYPGDWLRSTDLRSCSVGARGLWIDMICLMHEGNPYGYLKVGNKVILPETLASMVGAEITIVNGWLDELEQAAVFSRANDCIVCRRMIRDEKTRELRAAGGALGGNPALLGGRKDNPTGNLDLTPAFAVASSSAKDSKTVSDRSDCVAILEFLNEKTGRSYRPLPANLELIKARLKEATADDIRSVIAIKCRQWATDETMEKYLRPATLFGRQKFAQYLGELKDEVS